MTLPPPHITPLGDSAVTLSWGDAVSDELNRRVLGAMQAIESAALPEITDLVPAYAALTVWYDPLHLDYQEMAVRLATLAASADPADTAGGSRREHEIPVRYDGPDLEEVARQVGMTRAEVIECHAARTYRVYLLGFVPGFGYLGELDPRLVLPRRGTPRKVVPAGTVAIAGAQTAVYPLDTPGGWHLIGHTAVAMFDPDRAEPSLLRPGDDVRFIVGPR